MPLSSSESALKASIETKLKGVYAQRARLLAEEQEEQTEATSSV
jgi:hypothetical protein